MFVIFNFNNLHVITGVIKCDDFQNYCILLWKKKKIIVEKNICHMYLSQEMKINKQTEEFVTHYGSTYQAMEIHDDESETKKKMRSNYL